MSRAVNVVFRSGGKPYRFDAGEFEPAVGDQVVVETARGYNVGRVVSAPAAPAEGEARTDLKRVVRVANDDDLRRLEENAAFEREARELAAELIAESGLEMKLVSVESTFDQSKLLISFAAEKRVDFRKLVGRLSERLGRRVELRQVSARDEARLIGGYGSCGRRLCCTLFAGDQDPVSIRMAKDQNLPLNPSKISGVCGRLMCCLKYERDTYTSFKERAPRRGRTIGTPAGEGKVVELLPTRDLVTVDLGEGRRQTFTLEELGIEVRESGKTPEQTGGAPDHAAKEPGESGKEAAEKDEDEGPRETGKEAGNGGSDEAPVSG